MVEVDELSEAEVEALYQLLSQPDLLDFVRQTVSFELHEWQSKHLIPLLQDVAESKGRRILIHAPPQFGKSIILSQRYIAWLLGKYPEMRVKLACYNISKASDFGAVIVNLMQSEQFRDMFGPEAAIPKIASKEEFYTATRKTLKDGQPSFKALGIETGFVGQGAEIVIIDDPYPSPADAESEAYNKAFRRFWRETTVPRISEDANVIAMFHRYHAADAAQMFLEDGFEYWRFPAIADGNEDGSDPTGRQPDELLSPMRTREHLDKLREDDPQMFAGQFQGLPNAPEGTLFAKAQWRFEPDPEKWPDLKTKVRGWDLATSVKESGDYTAGPKLGIDDDETIWLWPIERFRAEWPDACDRIITVAKEDDGCPVAVESQGMQLGFIQQLARSDVFQRFEDREEFIQAVRLKNFVGAPLYGAPAKGDKKQRASGWAWYAARGKVVICGSEDDPWVQAFLAEARVFDGLGLSHDDQIDGVSIAWHLAKDLPRGRKAKHEEPQPGSPAFWTNYAKRHRQA